jgi:uncharacterized protein (TIGR02569 family)
VIDGWSAWRWLEGEHTPRRWPEIIAAGEAFHQVLEGVERPTFIDRRAHPWAIGDKVAWGELPPDDYKRAKHLLRLARALRRISQPAQLIHGDLTGNVLFAANHDPAIIDFSPYWRPSGYASAIVVADALVWEGADDSLLDVVAHVEVFPQLLLRALIFRIVADGHFQSGAPPRPDHADPYLPAVELALSLAER